MTKSASALSKKKHSKLGASNAERWMNCPGSVVLSEKAPPQAESRYAKEGTDAHFILEYLLKGHDLPNIPYSEDMWKHAHEAFQAIITMTPRGAFRLVEEKVDLSHIHPEMFGTLDCAIVDELGGELNIIDYKYGAGYAVEVPENLQLIYYALGLYHRYPEGTFHTIHLTVIQPRAQHIHGPVRSWMISGENLRKYEKIFQEAATLVKNQEPNSPKLRHGKWCKWCPAAVICPEVSQKAFAKLDLDFDVIHDWSLDETYSAIRQQLGYLHPKKLSDTLQAFEKIELWIEKIRDFAFRKMQSGVQIPGWKLVEKRSTRKWIDIDKASLEALEKWGKDAFSKPELLSPAQLEKKIKDLEWIAERVSSVSSGLTLVPESDRRSASNLIDKDFSIIEDEPSSR